EVAIYLILFSYEFIEPFLRRITSSDRLGESAPSLILSLIPNLISGSNRLIQGLPAVLVWHYPCPSPSRGVAASAACRAASPPAPASPLPPMSSSPSRTLADSQPGCRSL